MKKSKKTGLTKNFRQCLFFLSSDKIVTFSDIGQKLKPRKARIFGTLQGFSLARIERFELSRPFPDLLP